MDGRLLNIKPVSLGKEMQSPPQSGSASLTLAGQVPDEVWGSLITQRVPALRVNENSWNSGAA